MTDCAKLQFDSLNLIKWCSNNGMELNIIKSSKNYLLSYKNEKSILNLSIIYQIFHSDVFR